MMPRTVRSSTQSFEHQRVVLGLGQRLHALPGAGGRLVDVLADGGRADEADALDERVHQQGFGLDAAAGHQVDHALRQAGLDQQLKHAHRGLRAPSTRLSARRCCRS